MTVRMKDVVIGPKVDLAPALLVCFFSLQGDTSLVVDVQELAASEELVELQST